MNQEKMTVIGAFLNHRNGIADGDPNLENYFAVVSFVTETKEIARLNMSIHEAAELVFVPTEKFKVDMRAAEDPRAYIKEKETAKHKAEWIAKGQEHAARKAEEYQALHGVAPSEEYLQLWGREGFRYAGQAHMAKALKKFEPKAEARKARIMKRHAKWAFEMFQRTLADGSHSPAGYPNNIGGVVLVNGHELKPLYSRKPKPDGMGGETYPRIEWDLWGTKRPVSTIVRESDSQPVNVAFLGMPYDLAEERMYRKLRVDEDLRIKFARGEI